MTFRGLSKLKLFNFNNFRNVMRNNHVWTTENIVKSPYRHVAIPEMTVVDYMWQDLDKWATKPAMQCGVTNRCYSYEEVYKQSRTLAANLRNKFGIQNGDVVGVMARNIPEYATITYGILAAGGIVTTLNPIYTEYEAQRQIELSSIKLVLASEDVFDVIKKALTLAKINIPIIMIKVNKPLPENVVSFKELVEDVHVDLTVLNQVDRKPDDIAFLPYSSGTTGLPKGVELTNKNILANFEQQNTEARLYEYTTATYQDVCLTVLPLFHLYGLSVLMMHKMSAGLKIVTLPKFQPDTFLNALKVNRPRDLYVVPPMVLFMGTHPQVTPDHLAPVGKILSGAAPLPATDVEKVLSKTKENSMKVFQGYGLTEAGPLVTFGPVDCKDYESVGNALPNVELRVVDNDMKNLGPGQMGELLIKGPNIMKGYRSNPEENKKVFVDGEWYRSGDIAKIDESGLVYITDRLKELIKVKGYQVSPVELESVLKLHPGVHEAVVIGVPDSNSGERPKAFIVPLPGVTIKDQEIMNFVEKRVAPYKKIKEVVFVDSVPKNLTGKILRKMLR